MSLNDLANVIHENARAHGFLDKPRTFGDLCALIHSEVSEMFEAYRDGQMQPTYVPYHGDALRLKPEGVPSEAADVIIRVLDLCAEYDIDIERAITEKMDFNVTRDYKHGGKVI
jgi:NTP pyrophosphatase (non-canonical NTP hydrolase)